MKSATSTKVSYINKMDMCPSNHKMNAINNLAIYTTQITSQFLGSTFISHLTGLSCETIPCHRSVLPSKIPTHVKNKDDLNHYSTV